MTYRKNWGEDRVYFHDDHGQLRSLPVGWTSLSADDPFVVMSRERSSFRTMDLLELVVLIKNLQEACQDG